MTEKNIVDKYGLPIAEKCRYVKIDQNDEKEVTALLSDNSINHKVFLQASNAFAEEQAESQIRFFMDNQPGSERTSEEVMEEAVVHREEVGKEISDHTDSYVDYDKIANLSMAIYKDIIKRV
jgi:hypothetical protein